VFDERLLLPETGVLLHIGPHKTGTTAIQGALRLARAEMAKLDVIYAGKGRQHQMAALALTGGRGMRGDRPADRSDWDQLVSEVRANASKRVIVSSEYFDEVTDEVAEDVVDSFGPDRVHVVVTLRPIAKIMPSAWQQYVRNGVRWPYRKWLNGMLNKPPYDKPTPSFWRRHHHDVLVERWVKLVGPEQVVVVVLDESEPDSLMRTFERLVGLPTGMLVPEEGWENRSLTAAETELVRSVNVEYHARQWAPSIYNNVIRLGLTKQMQRRRPEPDEAGIVTPAWAIERANEIAAAAAERIQATGAHIVGDLASLSAVRPKDDASQEAPLPTEAATEALVGAIVATGIVTRKPPAPRKGIGHLVHKPPRARAIEEYSTRELMTVVRDRVVARYRRRGSGSANSSDGA
jgi:hypothetical protein